MLSVLASATAEDCYCWPASWASIVLHAVVCRRRLSSYVTLQAAGRVGGPAADTARLASTVPFR